MNALTGLLGSKKAWVTALILGVAGVLVGFGKMTAEQWTDLSKWVGGSYLVAQGVADHGRAGK